jgi:hypothetical protein
MDCVRADFDKLRKIGHELVNDDIRSLCYRIYREYEGFVDDITFDVICKKYSDKKNDNDLIYCHAMHKLLSIKEPHDNSELDESMEYFIKGAENGHKQCQIMLGIQYKLFGKSDYIANTILNSCESKTASSFAKLEPSQIHIVRHMFLNVGLYFTLQIYELINEPEKCIEKCFKESLDANLYETYKLIDNIRYLIGIYDINFINIIKIYFKYADEDYCKFTEKEFSTCIINNKSARKSINSCFSNIEKKSNSLKFKICINYISESQKHASFIKKYVETQEPADYAEGHNYFLRSLRGIIELSEWFDNFYIYGLPYISNIFINDISNIISQYMIPVDIITCPNI